MDANAHSLLVVDDDAVFRERLARAFTERGYDVRTAGTGDEAVAAAESESPEFAVVDLRMPGMHGLEVVERLHAIDGTTRIVVLTGYGSIATAVDALRRGAVNYLTKPADVEQILAALRSAVDPANPAEARAPGAAVSAAAGASMDHVPSLARVEWEHIERVVRDCGGNISKAAKALGLHRRSLQRKLAKHPVRR